MKIIIKKKKMTIRTESTENIWKLKKFKMTKIKTEIK